MKYSQFLIVVGYILCAFVLDLYGPTALASSELTVYRCPYWSTPEPAQQERFIDVLNGKKILFIGDSVTRYDSHRILAHATVKFEHKGNQDSSIYMLLP